MTRLADSDSRWRRRGVAAATAPAISVSRNTRSDSEFLLRHGFRRPQHGLVVPLATLEVVQLFQEVTFRLTEMCGMVAILRTPFGPWHSLHMLNLALNSRSVLGSGTP